MSEPLSRAGFRRTVSKLPFVLTRGRPVGRPLRGHMSFLRGRLILHARSRSTSPRARALPVAPVTLTGLRLTRVQRHMTSQHCASPDPEQPGDQAGVRHLNLPGQRTNNASDPLRLRAHLEGHFAIPLERTQDRRDALGRRGPRHRTVTPVRAVRGIKPTKRG